MRAALCLNPADYTLDVTLGPFEISAPLQRASPHIRPWFMTTGPLKDKPRLPGSGSLGQMSTGNNAGFMNDRT